jgi:beta-N-acetylhexosaminidase
MSRVRRLAEDLKTARQAAGRPPDLPPGWLHGEAEVIRTFSLQPGAGNWVRRASDLYTVVRLEGDPNIAAGGSPWGPFAAVAADQGASAESAFATRPVFLVTPGRSTVPAFPPGQPVLVVGRDIHRHSFAREAVDRLRSAHVDVLVVDMGWPSDDRRYADVATFGGSLLMGRALLRWLAAPGDSRGDGSPAPGDSGGDGSPQLGAGRA